MYVDRTGTENPLLKYGKRDKILQAASYCEPCLLTTAYSSFSLVLSLMEDVAQLLLYFKHIWSCYTTKSTGSSISLLQSSLVYWWLTQQTTHSVAPQPCLEHNTHGNLNISEELMLKFHFSLHLHSLRCECF